MRFARLSPSPFTRDVPRKNVPNGVNKGEGMHVGRNALAAQQATARVRELLRETFR